MLMFNDPPIAVRFITYLRETVYLGCCQFDSVKVTIRFDMFHFSIPPKDAMAYSVTSEKIHFSWTSCWDFVLASKMKQKFEFWTPPYFCDIGIFDKVAVTLKNKNLKSEPEV